MACHNLQEVAETFLVTGSAGSVELKNGIWEFPQAILFKRVAVNNWSLIQEDDML